MSRTQIASVSAVLAGIAAALVCFSTPSAAAPSVAWVPDSLSAPIATGETKEIVVSLSSAQGFKDPVSIWVAPELQRFVKVEPLTISDPAPGASAEVTLTIFAQQDAPVGTFTGTIHVQSSTNTARTLAKPLPVTVAVCRCVVKRDLSVSYPVGWRVNRSINEEGDSISLRLRNKDDAYVSGGFLEEGAAVIDIVTTPLVSLSLEDLALESKGTAHDSTESVVVSGRAGASVGYRDWISPGREEAGVSVYVPGERRLVTFILTYNAGDPLEPQHLAAFNAILQSVQFTE